MIRETLHMMDDAARVAIIDTQLNTAGAPVPGGQTIRYQYSDHLGTAALELDFTGTMLSYEEYYPFGSTSVQMAPLPGTLSLKRYRFTGKERDEGTGFYYIGARYYLPWLAGGVPTTLLIVNIIT